MANGCNCSTCNGRMAQTRFWCLDEKKHVSVPHEDSHQVFSLGLSWPPPKHSLPRPRFRITRLPASVDLRPIMVAAGVPTFDQGQIGSCTANCGCYDVALVKAKQGTYKAPFSRQFTYSQERIDIGTFPSDSGANMVDIGNVFSQYGVCFDSTMPYDTSNLDQTPTQAAYNEAANYKFDSKQTAPTPADFTASIYASQQDPMLGSVRLGFPVASSFMDAVTNGGWVPDPPANDSLLGGHAMELVGFAMLQGPKDSAPRLYILALQSWGNVGDTSSGLATFKFPFDVFSSAFFNNNGGTDNRQQRDLGTAPPPPPPPPPNGQINLTANPVTIPNNGTIPFIWTLTGLTTGDNYQVYLYGDNGVALQEQVGQVTQATMTGDLYYSGPYKGQAYLQAADATPNGPVISNQFNVIITQPSTCILGNGIAKFLNGFAILFGRQGRFKYEIA